MTLSSSPIPDDDPNRGLHVADPDAPDGTHLSVVGDTYTVLLSGTDTSGRFCLIDMHIPPGGGPPPHRHDFEESFTLLSGELEFMFRGEPCTLKAPHTIHIPANAPHAFRNASEAPARVLCICAPAGQEEFFAAMGDRVDGRTAPPPELSDDERKERTERGKSLAASYRTEILV